MKLALIPPKGYELSVLKGTAIMSLCIPSFYGSFAWSGAIRQARMQSKNYYHILDNGAAEGETANIETLINYGTQLGVDEMVLPDILGDCEGTLKLIDQFFAAAPKGVTKYNWMAPLQGKNPDEMLKAALLHVKNEAIGTLGIPRIFIDNTGVLNARTDLAYQIHRRFPGRFEIHFLGAHPAWPGEIKAAATYTKVRSFDTSLPFNATINGIELTNKTRMIKRPDHYFTDRRELDRGLLDRNIYTVMEWASGRAVSTQAPAS